jgi:AraC-like DNA-binding protein
MKSVLLLWSYRMPKPFHHENEFHWTDPDTAREAVRLLLWPHALSVTGSGAQLDAWMWSHRVRNISVTDMCYGTDVTVVPGKPESFYAVLMPLSGSSVVRSGGQIMRAERGGAAVASPSEPLSVRWPADCALRIVRIERPALEAHLGDMLGRPVGGPIGFTLGMDLTRGRGRIFAEEIARLVDLLNRYPHAFDQPLAAITTEQMLMTRLLEGALHDYRDELATRGVVVPSGIVREVVGLVESHPEWEHSVGSLAVAVGVSRRSLERAFRKHTGVSPWKYVKSVRLRRARDELRAADPERVTVGEVARRWGMTHSQFSAEYRRLYGETPTETRQALSRSEACL